MGPDPFNMPSFGGAQNYSGMLQSQASQLAPLATRWSGPAHGVPIAQAFNAQPQSQGQSNLSKFVHFLGGTASQIGHIAGGASTWLAKNAVNMVEAPGKFGADIGHGLVDRYELSTVNSRSQQLSGQLQNLHNQFKSGQISAKTYQAELKALSQGFSDLSNEAMGVNKQASVDFKQTVQSGIDTASTLVTILTAGFGADTAAITKAGLTPLTAKTASDYLTSTSANAFLQNVEKGVANLAASPELFAKLEPAAQQALQRATAEVVANAGGTMTAGQIARATAVNVALKYPVYYNYLSGTGNQIYKELDQKKYGDAVRTLAFNAALTLSGGPIGQALKYGGKALDTISSRTFGQTSFWDELSRFYGDGSKDGFAVTVSKMAGDIKDPIDREQFIRNLSAVEAMNVQAVGGDAGAAAMRVAQGMKSMYGDGVDLSQISHEDGIKDMVNYAEAYRIAHDEATRLGLPDIAIGRVDARQLNTISAALSPVLRAGKESVKDAWEALKAENPNQAWANNENFDRQIVGMINKYDNPGEFDAAIRGIRSSFNVEKFSKSVESKLGKMGYIPIKPVNLEAPFTEGTGKLTTQFSGGEDFFLQSVKPLPILSSLGDAVTSLGLSPNASSQKVYQLFNDNLATNLKDAGVVKNIMGENASQSTDTLIKQLSNYAHNPTRGKVMSHMPITDLRMLTVSDIKKALDVSTSEALSVQRAIADSYMQVPLAIRGLGDRAVDISYKAPGYGAFQRRYLRVQGAVRFAWNPFFQYLRVIPKTEILTEAEGGGYISSIFNGKLGQLNEIRSELRGVGAFEQPGSLGSVISAEATDFGGTTARNLTKKLLPTQEKSIAGLIGAQADRMGMDAKTYINTFPQNVRDTVQMIAQYDRRSNFLNSPLARTLNVAFFPFRFESKVATIFARNLAKTAPLTQVAVVNGVFKAHDFLNSAEGQAWYSKNADAIGLFKYITPIASFAEVFSSLLPGHDHSLGNFGELGGLPFGWIPQLLDSEGLTQFNQPGVNPKTGETYNQYIPVTMRGQVATAIADFVNSLFSYPGATIGAPSKGSITRGLVYPFVGASTKTDFQKTTPQTSPQQQNFADAVKAANPQPGTQGLSQTQQAQAQAQAVPKENQPTPFVPTYQTNPGTAVPRLPSQLDTMPGKQSKSGAGTKKKKKSDYTPYLLPGQSQLGQL